MTGLALPGLLTGQQLRATAEHIASQQLPSGLVPWFTGHHADPWDHVEAAMALSVAGMYAQARQAYAWSAATQASDGTWPMVTATEHGIEQTTDASVDANQCAYLAVGVWHHWLLTNDAAFVHSMWPVVRAAIDFVCDLQQPGGAICWSRDASGSVNPTALLTGSACMVLSIRCAVALGDLVGDPRPDWELSAGRLAHAVALHPDAFEDRSRFSMDWYYPVLGGAVRGAAARASIAARWDQFVVPGRGARCVSDRPWVTAAETCELVLTLDAVGDRVRAGQLMRDVQFCRADDGGYWTGWVYPEDEFWPAEQSTWTGAAVILAADALADHSAAHALFRGDDLPRLWQMIDCDEQCYARIGSVSDQ
ncbi:MAG: prenyltransferase [Actinomycetota bacterium]|nr:prenyltransferase [Actinomycetota bacterium]